MFADCFLVMESCLLDPRGRPVPGSVRFLDALIGSGVPFVILTNQSYATRDQMADRLLNAGFRNIVPAMFYTSTMAAIDAIVKKYPDRRRAAYLGGKGMIELLRETGFSLNMDRADWVFVGSDHNSSYNDYCYALKLIERGAYIISTDPRAAEVTRSNLLVGPGSIVKMLEYASGTKAVEAGIPAPLIVGRALKYLNVHPDRAVLACCHPEPEISCGVSAGIRTVLVMNGMDEKENALLRRVHPDYVVEDLTGLLR